eukprot:scaffold2229_cov262-Pinguiococcus_pyrenoidosus.AAC.5
MRTSKPVPTLSRGPLSGRLTPQLVPQAEVLRFLLQNWASSRPRLNDALLKWKGLPGFGKAFALLVAFVKVPFLLRHDAGGRKQDTLARLLQQAAIQHVGIADNRHLSVTTP